MHVVLLPSDVICSDVLITSVPDKPLVGSRGRLRKLDVARDLPQRPLAEYIWRGKLSQDGMGLVDLAM